MNLEGLTEKVTIGRWKTVYYENQEGDVVAKCCTKCGEVKNLSEFVKHKNSLGGVRPDCKVCKRAYREINAVRDSEYRKQYYSENKEKLRKDLYEWRKHNSEKLAIYSIRYEEKHPEKVRLAKKRWHAKNTIKEAKRKRRHYEENHEKYIESARNWRKQNKDKVALKHQRRRAHKLNLPNDFKAEQMTEILNVYGGCALTGSDDIHWDHVIPLATGQGGTIYGNMVPLRADLNMSKGDSNIFEWFEANRQRFNLEQWRFDRLIAWLASANAMSVEEYHEYVYWCHANPNVIDEDVAN